MDDFALSLNSSLDELLKPHSLNPQEGLVFVLQMQVLTSKESKLAYATPFNNTETCNQKEGLLVSLSPVKYSCHPR